MSDPEDNQYLSIEIRPRSDVINRILVLRALFYRGSFELIWQEGGEDLETLDEDRFDSLAELIEQRANSELTTAELNYLQTPIGRLAAERAETLALSMESLAAIAEAVGVTNSLPEPPALAAADNDFVDLLRALDRSTLDASIVLPSDESAAKGVELTELWLWRVDLELEFRQASDAERAEIEQSIDRVVGECVQAGYFEPNDNRDFPTVGRSVHERSVDELEVFELALSHRARGLRWLVGLDEVWRDSYFES
jgi:hypothetical protein